MYLYRNEEFYALRNITIEELNFVDGKLIGKSSAFFNNEIDFSMDMSFDGVRTIEYYQNGKLVVSMSFIGYFAGDYYLYEFENGVNLTLKELELINKEAAKLISDGDFDEAIDLLEQNLMYTNIPRETIQMISLEKSLVNARSKKEVYLKKEEEKRIAEEKRQHAKMIAEEKKRIAEEKRQRALLMAEMKKRAQQVAKSEGANNRSNNRELRCAHCGSFFSFEEGWYNGGSHEPYQYNDSYWKSRNIAYQTLGGSKLPAPKYCCKTHAY
jgi:hypothetical protein